MNFHFDGSLFAMFFVNEQILKISTVDGISDIINKQKNFGDNEGDVLY